MNPLTYGHLKPLQVALRDQQPYSEDYQDVYFSRHDGLAETRHVFLHHNRLEQRWQQAAGQAHFCVAETGFGTGLNFLATVAAWEAAELKPQQLVFISVEKHPLSLHSLQQAQQNFPELAPMAARLQKLWGSFRCGLHRLEFAPDITLLLVLGEAQAGLAQLQASVDAWFLDGFAPSKNPDMWHDGLFATMARLSQPGTTVATFTAASVVRNGLSKHGFDVVKQPGFGHKREMITATYQGTHHSGSPFWAPLPGAQNLTPGTTPAVTILGGGIAGLCVAHSMQRLGWHTTVIDQQAKPMQQASGNALAMMMPLLTAGNSPEALFYWRAFEAACHFYQTREFQPIGVRQELTDAKSQQWAQRLAQQALPDSLVQVNRNHVWYPNAGYIDTQQVAKRLLAAVDQWLVAAIKDCQQGPDGQWHLRDAAGQTVHRCELLVVANGMGAKTLNPTWFGQLQARHGQTSVLHAPVNAALDHVLLDQGYVIPDPRHKRWVCGATYDHVTDAAIDQTPILAADHWPCNLAWWQDHPLHATLSAAAVITGHAALRATTPDHLPLCGPVVDPVAFSQNCADLHHGRHWQTYATAPTIKNLYVINGLGSRGFTSAPLLAQLLAAMMTQQPLPLETDLCKMIHPNRFLYRSLKQPPNHR
ncbi:bifunctional tRNA (5-methylaminomethyl-2-thiouridine)(34)-methyltransferase MnmD/FAD-dependent 5-carboxymethylaminomethyl-2-thiouridine(34) oxidoreductase MnmC [Marinicella meishanensis]|uniref:bifunctional tRNA (5-methylaminomethyl-2-thiouridine)(34)-methyltransferase MnmD/FAD-dependent 5-carboxymethylaminomethyl-2-thiouridine(34) oxidoreductase MnmC n=1 Tax=Marinicella meishanensis TaxID=2873263 RepID=UPI001CBF7DA5|nr:bifunctional tRNA (5-methylaminomethyl-2-thiouridine)(34)-methyltransferase MnmD/FAD-dependent 5-carboxymethylaminomethyl-2-thiouridine(34) oxidoreductase MnmC [Marinicella sp. NBU2979]